MSEPGKSRKLRALTAEIAASYVIGHPGAALDLPKVIATVHASLAGLDPAAIPAGASPTPAVPIKRSVGGDHLVCLECGLALKTLKRHLRAVHDLLPKQYREKWRLAPAYPMVAPRYAEQRSRHAKAMGLGRRPKTVR